MERDAKEKSKLRLTSMVDTEMNVAQAESGPGPKDSAREKTKLHLTSG